MAPPIEVIAIITPAAGKLDRVLNLLTALAVAVQKTKPGCLKYHLHRQLDNMEAAAGEEGRLGEGLVMVETYADRAAWEQHRQSAGFEGLVERRREEGLVAKGLEVMCLEPVAGFAGRLEGSGGEGVY